MGQCGLTHIVLSRILYKFPRKLVLKCLLKNCIWDMTVWSILSFQGSYSYTDFHQKLFFCFFLFSFVFCFVLFFLMFKNLLKQLYQGQYGLTHIVFSRILYQCSPNASIFFCAKKANSDQDKIRIQTYCPFKDILLLEIFLKIF